MLMIIASHFAQSGGFNFPINEISINRLWQQWLYMHGQFGNDLFVLISGYFLVNSKEVKFSRIFNLLARVIFYFVLMMCCLIYFKMPYQREVVLSNWWFIKAYIALYLIHHYINILLNNLSRDEYKKMLIMLGIYWSLLPTLIRFFFATDSLINFIYLYSLAGYFKLHAKDYGSKKFILYGFLFIFLNVCTVIVFDLLGLRNPFFIKHAFYFMGMMTPFTLLGALCMFLGFRKIALRNNKLINFIASATFGVYLLHANTFFENWAWSNVFHTASFQDSPYLIPYSIGVMILVFAVCTLIEIARSKIFRLISHGRLS